MVVSQSLLSWYRSMKQEHSCSHVHFQVFFLLQLDCPNLSPVNVYIQSILLCLHHGIIMLNSLWERFFLLIPCLNQHIAYLQMLYHEKMISRWKIEVSFSTRQIILCYSENFHRKVTTTDILVKLANKFILKCSFMRILSMK